MEVWALDQLTQIGRITTYTRVQATERDLGIGGWSLEMPLGDPAGPAAKLLAATWPGVEIYDPEGGSRFGGFVTDSIISVDDQGVETVQFIGKDFQADLASWMEWPDPDNFANLWQNVPGGSIPATTDAHNTVGLQAGGGGFISGRPQIFGMVHGPDPGAGPPKARRLKFDPLLDVLKFLFLGTDYTARLRLIRDPATGVGSVLFETPARGVAEIRLDAKQGSFGRIEVRRSAYKVTSPIAVGAEVPGGAPGERYVDGVFSVPYERSWQFRHREDLLNRPGSDADTLHDEMTHSWATGGGAGGLAVKVDSARVDGYGSTIDLGWMVDVALGATFTPSSARLPVVASTLTFAPGEGWQRTVDVGTESIDGAAAIYAAIARVSARSQKIENEL